MLDPGEQHREVGQDPNLVGLLSLQLLLLAFFILLSTISTFDESRVRSVLGSVQEAFSDVTGNADSNDAEMQADSIVLSAVVDAVEGVMSTALQLDRVSRVGDGDVVFDLSSDSLFAAGSAQIAPGHADVLRRIVVALDRRPSGYRYELDILGGRAAAAAGAGAGDAAPLPALEIDRAGALARALVEAGATPSGLSSGLLPGASDKLRVVIRLIQQPRAQGLFGSAAPSASETSQ